MLFEELELVYEYVGCCIVEYPRWLSLVFRAVGLTGDGEMGDLRDSTIGDLSDRDGLAEFVAAMLNESLGFPILEAAC